MTWLVKGCDFSRNTVKYQLGRPLPPQKRRLLLLHLSDEHWSPLSSQPLGAPFPSPTSLLEWSLWHTPDMSHRISPVRIISSRKVGFLRKLSFTHPKCGPMHKARLVVEDKVKKMKGQRQVPSSQDEEVTEYWEFGLMSVHSNYPLPIRRQLIESDIFGMNSHGKCRRACTRWWPSLHWW